MRRQLRPVVHGRTSPIPKRSWLVSRTETPAGTSRRQAKLSRQSCDKGTQTWSLALHAFGDEAREESAHAGEIVNVLFGRRQPLLGEQARVSAALAIFQRQQALDLVQSEAELLRALDEVQDKCETAIQHAQRQTVRARLFERPTNQGVGGRDTPPAQLRDSCAALL